jgi:hypothetical protein
MRRLSLILVALTALLSAGCGGSSNGKAAKAVPKAAPSDQQLITTVSERWANAYATGDYVTSCALEQSKYEDQCRNFVNRGTPTAYQRGYLHAKVDKIHESSSRRALVTLSNGCKLRLADEGKHDWHVWDAGGHALGAHCRY